MQRIILALLSLFTTLISQAQVPGVVKAVAGTVTEPSARNQEGWKSNEWNGLFFYQGTGSPSKLCVTDGTNAGTQFVADIGGGTVVATIPAQDFMFIITNRLASISPFANEAQIWRSNGTAGGTSLVYTMPLAGVSNSNVWTSDRDAKRNFSVSVNTMFFNGYDAANGNELWVTDGTATGTHIVKDINAGSGGSSPLAFCKLGNDVFFTAIESSGRKLWKTDGTEAGTIQISVAEPFFILDNAVGIVNNKMIFYAHNTVDGFEPYVSDGTAAGTFMLANIHPAGNSWLTQSQNVHLRFNSNYCFFIAFNGTANGLWRTDGTSAGTIQLSSNAQAVFSGVSGGSYTETDENGLWMIEYNSAGSGSNEKLYRSDGTVAGTYLVASGLSFAQYLKSYKGGLWMASRNTGSPANTEPWRSGGIAPATNRAFEIEPGNSGSPTFTPLSSNPYAFFVKNGKLYFFAERSIPSGHNLYQYTGDFTFNGSVTGGRWRDSANWNGMMPPGITDTVYVNAGTPNILHVDGANAYVGVLNAGNNANINLLNSTDTLFINRQVNTTSNNTFGFPGTIAFKNYEGDTVKINGGFEVNNIAVKSPASVFSGSILLYQQMNFSGGKLFLNNNNFRLRINATTNATASNYFVTNGTGSLVAEGLGTGQSIQPRVFPVGTVSGYAPVTITNTGDADTFSARVMDGLYPNYTGETPSGSVYSAGAVNHTWFINETVPGGSNVNLTLQWNGSKELPGFDRTQSLLGHYTGGTWNLGTAGNASGLNPYTLSRAGISSFSPFGISSNATVLPLTFLSFNAAKCNNQVCLNWTTANEQQVSHFIVERSKGGGAFVPLKNIAARNQPYNQYSISDETAAGSGRQLLLYRIRQVDTDGKYTFSQIRAITIDNDAPVLFYPNPVADQINLVNWQGISDVVLYDMNGHLVRQWKVNGAVLLLGKELPRGQYLLRIRKKNGAEEQQPLLHL
ncbi:MAG: T9SS type A sorting domain-containing protein [Bacteroidetes bacterium]|nr:T9SS type A sorting domain-containing protein [Bacteroidota bacterium]